MMVSSRRRTAHGEKFYLCHKPITMRSICDPSRGRVLLPAGSGGLAGRLTTA